MLEALKYWSVGLKPYQRETPKKTSIEVAWKDMLEYEVLENIYVV